MRDISLHIMDIVQNSITAGASLIQIIIKEDSITDAINIDIIDNGRGIQEKDLAKVCDPFYTTRNTRSVGLGLSLFKLAAKLTGGDLSVKSNAGVLTTVSAKFIKSSIDMIPFGDINSTIVLLIKCNPNLDFIYKRSVDNCSFILDTREIKMKLENEVPIDSDEVIKFIKDFLDENTNILLEGS